MSLTELARVTGGKVEGNGADKELIFERVSTDSRSTVEATLFVALVGERFDGHDFLEMSVAGGASAVVISHGELDAG